MGPGIQQLRGQDFARVILKTGKRFWGLERILGTGIVLEVGKDLQIRSDTLTYAILNKNRSHPCAATMLIFSFLAEIIPLHQRGFVENDNANQHIPYGRSSL